MSVNDPLEMGYGSSPVMDSKKSATDDSGEKRTRIEQAESRTEQAETRAERAESRTEQAEARAEQAETALERIVEEKDSEKEEISTQSPKNFKLSAVELSAVVNHQSLLERLTRRQREILLLIAEGKNTKSIAALLNVSPKTVEYHRMKLMNCLNLHEISGLVRFAMQAGLVHQEKI